MPPGHELQVCTWGIRAAGPRTTRLVHGWVPKAPTLRFFHERRKLQKRK